MNENKWITKNAVWKPWARDLSAFSLCPVSLQYEGSEPVEKERLSCDNEQKHYISKTNRKKTDWNHKDKWKCKGNLMFWQGGSFVENLHRFISISCILKMCWKCVSPLIFLNLCMDLLFTPFFKQFLSLWCTKDFYLGHFQQPFPSAVQNCPRI